MADLNYFKLKELHRLKRHNYTDDFSIRIHRSLSWINRAEKKDEDIDSRFIFYWIAFNSAYSAIQKSQYFETERRIYKDFFEKILRYDTSENIYNSIWNQFSGSVRNLLNNKFIFGPFWNFHNGHEGFENWEDKFRESKSVAIKALQNKNTLLILEILFDRLYTLRNQILHGGATWNGNINRSQIKDGESIIRFLVPNLLQIMMNNQNENWGKLVFPVVES